MSETKDFSERPKDEEIFQRDGFRCVYCGFDGRNFKGWAYLQVDHFKPRSLGGKEEASNLVTACVVCNHMKGAKTWASIDEARKEISVWWDQMRQYWENNVQPLIPRQKE